MGDLPGYSRLLSAHDRQIYGVQPCEGYRTLSCVADSSQSSPASNLPALYLLVRGIPVRRPTLSESPFGRLPAAGFLQMLHHCNTLALGYPSPPSGWVWTLPAICAILPVSPFSSRALPGTQQFATPERKKPRPVSNALYFNTINHKQNKKELS